MKKKRNAPLKNDTLPEYLARLHKLTRIKRQDAAAKIGLSRGHYSRVLAGKHRIRDQKLDALASIFGVPASSMDQFRGKPSRERTIHSVLKSDAALQEFLGCTLDAMALKWVRKRMLPVQVLVMRERQERAKSAREEIERKKREEAR